MPDPLTPHLAVARQRFGARMRALRVQAGMTQEQLAERLDVDRKTVNRAEGGHHAASFDRIVLLADALDVEPVELFRW